MSSDWRAYYCDENADSNRRLDAEAARQAEYAADALVFRFAEPCRCSLPEQSCARCRAAAARNEQQSKQAR